MDVKKTAIRRRRVGVTLVSALATIAITLTGGGIAPLPAETAAAAAPVPRAASTATNSNRAPSAAEPVFMSIFTPRLTLPAAVKAPSAHEAGAFAALNALIHRETLFGDDIVGMRASIDRAQAASSAGAQLWFVRQANASAEYALGASKLVGSFPALQARVARAFVADKMSVTLTAAQLATAKVKLLGGLPSPYIHLLELAADAFQPSTVPEVALLRAAILDTSPLEQVLTQATLRTLVLPAALASSSVIAPEARLASALKGFADGLLQPVPPTALGGAAPVPSPTPGSSPTEKGGTRALARTWARPCTSPRMPLKLRLTGLSSPKSQKPQKPSNRRRRGSDTRSPLSLSARPTPRSAKAQRPARAAVGAAGAAVAPPLTASRTSKRSLEQATPSRPPGSSPWQSRLQTTSTSRSASNASPVQLTLHWTRQRQ